MLDIHESSKQYLSLSTQFGVARRVNNYIDA